MAGTKRKYWAFDKQPIPPGWVGCPAYGEAISCIIPSKVPLRESLNDYIPAGETYTPKQLIHEQRLLGRDVGLVIDLTNTSRYYPSSDWTKQAIPHVKIQCKGRDSVPDDAAVDRFVSEASQFCCHPTNPNKFIVVHCTHGHNRTGFMIAHFLIRTQRMSVSEALNKFAKARHPGIYKKDYIDALFQFYQERKDEALVCPPTPVWKNAEAVRNQGMTIDDVLDEAVVGPPTPVWKNAEAVSVRNRGMTIDDVLDEAVVGPPTPVWKNAEAVTVRNQGMTIDDVLGEKISLEQQKTLQEACYRALKLDVWGRRSFPGSHPVSLDWNNIQHLRQRYYYVSWKADGTRYMLLITRQACYLIDRNFCFKRVHMRFPCKFSNKVINTHHNTLLDGEMVVDTDKNTQKQERRYLIYDVMEMNGSPVTELPFHERWKMIQKEVIEPRNMERKTLSQSYDLEPFSVMRKDFWLLSTATKVLTDFIPNKLSHASDGLIFQGWDDPYVPRTHDGLLKWKFPQMNSVDFLFQLGHGNQRQLFLNDRGKKKLMEAYINKLDFKDERVLYPALCSGKIIECFWDAKKNVWVCMRIRPDKSTPNELTTYEKVMQSIRDNITEQLLLEEIAQIVRLPMYADRIQADIKAHQRASSARPPHQFRCGRATFGPRRERNPAAPRTY